MDETTRPSRRDPAKARAARTRIKHERWADEMRAAGWTCTEPSVRESATADEPIRNRP